MNRFFGMFDATTGRLQYNKGPFGQYVVGPAFSPDGTLVAATGCENVLRLFDAATGEVVLSLSRRNCIIRRELRNERATNSCHSAYGNGVPACYA